MKILFCSSEVVPFAKTGGLADVCGTLPVALEKLGLEVCVTLPLYRCVDIKEHQLKRLNQEILVGSIGENIPVYFIDHKKYYDRDGIYGTSHGDFPDNLERFQFYCSKTLELLKQLNLKVDIIHCHDWQTALIPAYLKFLFHNHAFYKKMRSVFTIHNLAYQGLFPKEEYPKLKLERRLFGIDGFEFYDQVNLMKGGIRFSDMVTTVSPAYAKEIQADEFGCGLAGDLRVRKNKVTGILNGLDYGFWNPRTDPLIAEKFSPEDSEKKADNKTFLQKKFKLPVKKDVPLFGYVGRLAYQKGIDLMADALKEMVKMDAQVVFLGVGEKKYEDILKNLAKEYPEHMACFIGFDEKMAHQVYAGSDFFLMPSRYEPCGLSQMISLAYGTVPIVFKTGGLADTIQEFEGSREEGNGFIFSEYKAGAFVKEIKKALKLFQERPKLSRLVKRSFDYKFSWEKSAQEYKRVYRECLASE